MGRFDFKEVYGKLDSTGKFMQMGRYWLHIETGKLIPIIQGGGPPNTIQNRFAFGLDDGTESGHTLGTEDANLTGQVGDVTFLIRLQVEETNGKDDIWTFQLFAQKNGSGGYTAVTATRTDGLRLANDTQSRADDSATTERLTAGAGSWDTEGGLYDDGQTQDGMGTSITLNGSYVDLEFAIEIEKATAANDDYWDLQVYATDTTALDGYTTTPRVTASIPADIYPAAVVAGADSVLGEARQASLSLSPTLVAAGADSIDPTFQTLISIKPSTDDTIGNWVDELDGTTNIYTSIDEVVRSDSDYIESGAGPSTDIYRTKLQTGTDPSTGDYHFVDYAYRKNFASGTLNLTVRLKEGVTARVTWNHNDVGATWTEVRQILSGAQADSITDYSNLYLEFEADTP